MGVEPLACTGPVAMEVLAGGAPERVADVQRMLDGLEQVVVDPVEDFVWAADAYRRERGTPVRSPVDCLIAAACVREQVVLAHRDADFEELASVTDLRTVDLR